MNTVTPIFFSSLAEEIPIEVLKIASDLHCQQSRNLSIEMSTLITIGQMDGLFRIEANELTFISIEAKNHCAAMHSFRKFADSDLLVDFRKIFDEAQQLSLYELRCYEKFWDADYASGRFLGLMSQKLNIVHAGIKAIADSDSDARNILNLIGNALPFLGEISVQDLVDLAATQPPKTVPVFFTQVSGYLSVHSLSAKALYDFVRENMTDANASLYGATLFGMVTAGQAREAIELALNDADSDYIDLSATALWVLGCLSSHWENEFDLRSPIQEALKKMAYHSNSSINLEALKALSNAAANQPELVTELLSHAHSKNQMAIQVLGNFVVTHFSLAKDFPNLVDILYALTDLNVEHTHVLDNILSQLLENGIHNQLVYDCLTAWVLKNSAKTIENEQLLSCFSQSIMELVNKSLLSELITRWLISDEQVLGAAFSDLVGHLWSHGIRQLIFSKDILDTLSDEDFKYLARRLLGWTFFEEPLLALTFSFLETKDAQQRTFGYVHALLVKEIGRDYPSATLKAIQEKLSKSTPEEEELLHITKKELLTYTDTIKQLPIRNELHPPIPMRVRHAIALKNAKEQREAGEQASEQSIFQHFCTTIHLKAGRGSFSIYDGKIGEINRLASHSVFFTLPAQYIIDPLNDEITRMGIRLTKRGDE